MVLLIVIVLLMLGRPNASNVKSPPGTTERVTPFGAEEVTSVVPVVGCFSNVGVAHPAAVAAITWLAERHTNTGARQAIAVFCA